MLPKELPLAIQHPELVAVEIIGNPTAGEIAVLPAVAEVVDHEDVVLAAVVEGLDQIGADEADFAGDDANINEE